MRPLTEELRTHFGAQADRGVLIGKVEPGSAAAGAGIRVADVLVTVGGTAVAEASDVRRALGEKKEGEMVPVVVVRERKPLTLAVKVPKAEPAPFGKREGLDGFDLPRSGMRMFNLDEVEKRLDDIERRLGKLEAH